MSALILELRFLIRNYVLGLNPEGFQFNKANIVNDNTISVTDVMAIVDIVLGLNTNHTQASSRNQ